METEKWPEAVDRTVRWKNSIDGFWSIWRLVGLLGEVGDGKIIDLRWAGNVETKLIDKFLKDRV